MPGFTKDTQLESWSMGKSLTATLFALLVKDGTYTLEQPAPVPEWKAPYLQDGMWRGQRLLPEGWATFVSTPAPAWRQRYGGFFWLNRPGVLDLPADAYYALGAGGQIMLVVPSRQLVIVRLGRSTGSQVGMRALNKALGLLTGAIRER
jgi:CubicO group peptidase (beta-lactamase class C family)